MGLPGSDWPQLLHTNTHKVAAPLTGVRTDSGDQTQSFSPFISSFPPLAPLTLTVNRRMKSLRSVSVSVSAHKHQTPQNTTYIHSAAFHRPLRAQSAPIGRFPKGAGRTGSAETQSDQQRAPKLRLVVLAL